MNTFLWVLQGCLASLMVMSGISKLVQPRDKLVNTYPWMQNVSKGSIRSIAAVEVIGAAGLIGPAATRIASVLTPIAAVGLMVFAVLAAILHLRRREASGVAIVSVMFLVAAVIAWGRFGPYGW
ncbi:DoxX family protein [Nocardia sp. NRRL WC-3656]|uniref:DoxX family protein n=1 Tax=Nocardia sp. NRRL WC-3656 TaxID=1463824 RepID=UPI0004C41D91|nr:DoxX family protein [Nocardia sp. NRRL WC-3656]